MGPDVEIIGLGKLEKLISYWQSQSFEWHVKRGLRLTRAENPGLRLHSHVDKSTLGLLRKEEIRKIALGVKTQIFCVSSAHTGNHSASVG